MGCQLDWNPDAIFSKSLPSDRITNRSGSGWQNSMSGQILLTTATYLASGAHSAFTSFGGPVATPCKFVPSRFIVNMSSLHASKDLAPTGGHPRKLWL